MSIRTIEQVKADISQTPITKDCPFKIGDQVTYTNSYGIKFDGHKVIGFCDGTGLLFDQGKHIYIDTDCYWCPVSDHSLTKENINQDINERFK